MQTAIVGNGENTGVNLAHLAAKAAESKEIAEDLLEIGKRRVERAIRKGRERGEDYLEDASYYVRHHPWQSVGVAVTVGAFAGLLFGLVCFRTTRA